MTRYLLLFGLCLFSTSLLASELDERACKVNFDECAVKIQHCQNRWQRYEQCKNDINNCHNQANQQYKSCVASAHTNWDRCMQQMGNGNKAWAACDKYSANHCKQSREVCPAYNSCAQPESCDRITEACNVKYQVCMRDAKAPPATSLQSIPATPAYPAAPPPVQTYHRPEPATRTHESDKELYSALKLAIEKENLKEIEQLIQRGAPLTSPGGTWDSALCLATQMKGDKTRLVRLLLDEGSRINEKCNPNMQQTALYYAASNDNLAIAKMLLEEGANPRHDRLVFSALYPAVEKGHIQMARLLIKHGVDINQDDDGRTMLAYANSRAMARFLIKQGVQRDHVLLYAAAKGDIELLKKALAEGADINPKQAYSTPLLQATTNNHPAIVELLLKHGADKYQLVHGHAVFEYGIGKLPYKLLERLYPGDKQPPGPAALSTLLLQATRQNVDVQTIKLLVTNGADVNTRPDIGSSYQDTTPLHEAVRQGNIAVARYLLSQHADPNATRRPDSFYRPTTMLDSAGQSGSYQMVKLFYPKDPAQKPTTEKLNHMLCYAKEVRLTKFLTAQGATKCVVPLR